MSEGQEGNTDGGEGREWVEQVPEFARGWGEIDKAESMEALFNNFGEMRSHIGRSIKIPGEDASTEDMTAFHQKMMDKVPGLMQTPDMDDAEVVSNLQAKMGKPESLDGYKAPESEDVTFNDEQLADIKGLAQELGLTKKQFTKLAEKMGTQNAAQTSAAKDANATEIKAIQEEWGLAAEAKYQATVNFAKQAGAPEGLVEALTNKEVDAKTVFWLANLAKGTSETSIVDFNNNNSTGILSPGEAQDRIDEILQNPEHAYHKGDKRAKDKMHEFMALANPGRYGT